jgi:SPP1 family predicted phage head-tail adaptor
MQAGKLTRLVELQRLLTAKDSTGAIPVAWTTYAKVYAHIDPYVDSARSGRETYEHEEVQSIVYTRVHLYYLAGVSPKDRVLYHADSGDRKFDILVVNNRDERNEEMELICKERQ